MTDPVEDTILTEQEQRDTAEFVALMESLTADDLEIVESRVYHYPVNPVA